MKITFLSGGTGTPKLLAGFRDLESINNADMTIVANTADDVMVSGNLVCPDLDTVLYTMAGVIDEESWFGIEGDSHVTHERIQSLSDAKPRGAYLPERKQTEGSKLGRWRRFSGYHEFMRIGDRDRATHVTRSALLEEGSDLTGATERISDALGIDATVLPMTNDPVASMIHTPAELMHFQEYWLGRGGKPAVESIEFRGVETARPTGAVRSALDGPVIIGPSNPVTSVEPILEMPGVLGALQNSYVVAVSPFVNDRVFSGPAKTFMKATGREPSTRGMLNMYEPFLDAVILDNKDETDTGCHVFRTDTEISTPDKAQSLAEDILVGLRNWND